MSKSAQHALQRSGAALYRIGLANTITIILFILVMKDISALQWRCMKRKSCIDSFCNAMAACCAYVHSLHRSGAAHLHSHNHMTQDKTMMFGGTREHVTELYEQGHVLGKLNASVARFLTASVEQRQRILTASGVPVARSKAASAAVSYTHLTLPTIYSV